MQSTNLATLENSVFEFKLSPIDNNLQSKNVVSKDMMLYTLYAFVDCFMRFLCRPIGVSIRCYYVWLNSVVVQTLYKYMHDNTCICHTPVLFWIDCKPCISSIFLRSFSIAKRLNANEQRF